MGKFRLKHKYLNNLDYENCNYLNYGIVKKIFYLESDEDTKDYQTIFTDEEIENLVNSKGLNLQDWIKEEIENDNTITATETLKFEDFSLKEQERFLDMIFKDGLTVEEAYEKMADKIIDEMISYFNEKNFIFSEMYIDKRLKLKVDFTNAMTKYMSFYNFIKHLVKNGNLNEKIVREKIKEIEK